MSVASIRVSVSVRLIIRLPDGRFLIITDIHSDNAGTPTGWFIGGGATGSDKQIADLAKKFGAFDFEGVKGSEDDNDLRFKVPLANLSEVGKWVKKRERKLDFPGVAKQELIEETKECGLPLALAKRLAIAKKHFGLVSRKRIDHSYLTFPVRPVETFCYDYLVLATVPKNMVTELEAVVARERRLHLVTREEIEAGRSNDGLPIPEFCKNWLPKR